MATKLQKSNKSELVEIVNATRAQIDNATTYDDVVAVELPSLDVIGADKYIEIMQYRDARLNQLRADERAADKAALDLARSRAHKSAGEPKPKRVEFKLPALAVDSPDFDGLRTLARASYHLANPNGEPYAQDYVESACASDSDAILAACAHLFARNPQGGASHAARGNVIRDAFGPALKVVTALEAAGKLPAGSATTYQDRADWLRYASAALAGLPDAVKFEDDVIRTPKDAGFTPRAKTKKDNQ